MFERDVIREKFPRGGGMEKNMRINKKIMAAICAAMMMTTLSACGSSKGSNADYIDGVLDVAYFADDVNDAVSMSDDEIKAAREICKEKEAEFIKAFYNMEEVSDESQKAFEDIAEKLCGATNYSVSAKGDTVTVTIKPLKVYSEELQKYVDEFAVKKYVDADESCTEKEFVDKVTELMNKSAENPSYANEVKIEVSVTKKDGKYSISDEDLAKIDDAMFVYTAE